MSELALNQERQASVATARKVGGRTLWAAGVFKQELGVNDPLTHLEQYLEYGEAAMPAIDEDLITDIAERKLKPTFINQVHFSRVAGDFISSENKFSMRQMTTITEAKFSNNNSADLQLYKRAKIESKEVDRLNQWFDTAEIDDVFIVESMPLGDERYTVVRIHQKVGYGELIEHVITLHNATVDIFNQLHRDLGSKAPDSQTKLELLDNMFAHRPNSHDFGSNYVAAFDGILTLRNSGQQFRFGLPVNEKNGGEDDIEKVRRQTALRSVYLDTLKALKRSEGYVTPEIISASHNLGCGFNMFEGDEISAGLARELLDRSLQSVAATFNRASKEHLENLAASQDGSMAADYAGHYGGQARTEGIRYDGACPSASNAGTAEAANLDLAHRVNRDPSQCGTCPNCRKEYFVQDEVYKEKILECNNCHSAIRFNGRAVTKEELRRLHHPEQKGILDLIAESFTEFNRLYKAEQAQKKTAKIALQKTKPTKISKAA